MRNYYMCKYYFNASHSFNNNKATAHNHTFTLMLYVGIRVKDEGVNADDIDKQVIRFLARYEDRYLNELPEFEGKDGSLESIGNTFYEALKIQFRGTPFSLYQLDIADNPLSVYQVADRILLPTLNMENSKENYSAILKQRKQLEEIYGG